MALWCCFERIVSAANTLWRRVEQVLEEMPNKAGNLTRMERVFVERMAATGDAVYAAEKAGYGSPNARASQNMSNPRIVETIQRRIEREMQDTIVPIALERHRLILLDPLAPAGAVVMAIKLAYDRGGVKSDEADKDPAEMTADELQLRIRKANAALAEIASRARVVDHVETPESPQCAQAAPNLFD